MVLHDPLGYVQGAGRVKPASIVISAALLTVVGGAAVITKGERRLLSDATVSAPQSSLHWASVSLEGASLDPVRPPLAILYVLPSCPHCAPAVRAFDVEGRARGLRTMVLSGSGAGDVADYQRKTQLRTAIAVDSGRAFARSAGVKWVPSLILVSSAGVARVFPIPAPVLIGRYLGELK